MKKDLNLFLIGVAKAGTTSIWSVLNSVTKIKMCPIKEPSIFSFADTKSRLEYALSSGWANVGTPSYIGEASPIYSEVKLCPKIPERINKYNPEAKIILVARHPIDRMFSVWRQAKSTGHDLVNLYANKTDIPVGLMPNNFRAALLEYPPFIDGSKYWTIYQAYKEYFDDSQIKVMLYEDLKESPENFYSELFSFLKISPRCELPLNTKANVGEKKRTEFPLYRKAKNSKLGCYFRRSCPGLGKYLRPFVSRKIRINDSMLMIAKQIVRDHLQDESEKILKHCGRDINFWKI